MRGKEADNFSGVDELLNERLESQNTNMGLLMKIYEKNRSVVESSLNRNPNVRKEEKKVRV